jgi:microcystin-dependent protein
MEGMIGEIRMFGGNFAPRAWAFCDGQLLAISTHTALFSILGTIYGGDGRTTFALPDVRGRFVLGPGHGPGLSSYREGQKGGHETNTMTVSTMPSHNHSFMFKASPQDPDFGQASVISKLEVRPTTGTATSLRYASTNNGSMHEDAFALGSTGGGIPFNNVMPFQVVNYVICMQGVFPSRG